MMGLEVMTEGVRAGTHSEGGRERIPDGRSCNTETVGAMLIFCQSVWLSVYFQAACILMVATYVNICPVMMLFGISLCHMPVIIIEI